MKQDTLAPWAEPVPDAPFPVTADDLLTMPDDGFTYEVIDGRLVKMPGSGARASKIAGYIVTRLNIFVRSRKLGMVTEGTGEYNLTRPGEAQETALIPDAAFVGADRLPPEDSAAFDKALHLAPDLAVEVASPNQFRPEMAAKARLYLERGVRLVWVIWPADKQIDVWRADSDEPAATFGVNDQLDGGDVLPGFTHPVVDLFE